MNTVRKRHLRVTACYKNGTVFHSQYQVHESYKAQPLRNEFPLQ